MERRPVSTVFPTGVRGVRRVGASAALAPDGISPTWTVWGGGSVDHPTWAIHASSNTPATVLHPLVSGLARAHSSGKLTSDGRLRPKSAPHPRRQHPGRPARRPRALALGCPGAHEGLGLRANVLALL
ncbi:DUF317 domain-containing protein [Streptomyces sp. RPA4-5]|nr:DUF317 domain-containing protein [Streptomyces sp. RPA4-5]